MCIWENKPLEKKIAENNIEVIKILECEEDGTLRSPYMARLTKKFNLSEEDVTWKIGETKRANTGTEERIPGITHIYLTTSGLYSYKTNHKHGAIYKSFKAIIPKGSEYYENYEGYCSNQLKILEELK